MTIERSRLCLALALLGVVLGSACSRGRDAPLQPPLQAPLRQEPTVRVGLAVRVPTLELEVTGPVALQCCGQHEEVLDGATLRVAATPEFVLDTGDGRTHRAGGRIVLSMLSASSRVVLGEDGFVGRLEIRRNGGTLTLVNEIGLEDYLRGVVPWEIGWHDESRNGAVEAQAIAARTYACKRLGQYPDEGFDLYADVTDQVYRGTTRQDATADRAIDTTRGLVMTNGKRLVEAYYSSTCGGHTSRIEEVWEKPAESYLRGRRDAPESGGRSFCASSRHFRWTEAWSGADLERVLRETLPATLRMGAGVDIGALRDLRIAARDSSGRVATLEVHTTTGVHRVHGDSIRWVLRPKDRAILRSTLFKLEVVRDGGDAGDAGRIVKVIIRGGGNGHGVGMCQVGALEMARRGHTHDGILTHYYPGIEILQMY